MLKIITMHDRVPCPEEAGFNCSAASSLCLQHFCQGSMHDSQCRRLPEHCGRHSSLHSGWTERRAGRSGKLRHPKIPDQLSLKCKTALAFLLLCWCNGMICRVGLDRRMRLSQVSCSRALAQASTEATRLDDHASARVHRQTCGH